MDEDWHISHRQLYIVELALSLAGFQAVHCNNYRFIKTTFVSIVSYIAALLPLDLI